MKLPPPSPRPKVASAFLAVPIVFAAGLGISLVALIVMGKLGSQATGNRLVIQAQTACADGSAAVVRARAEAIGLGEPEIVVNSDGYILTATMPGLPDDHEAIPALLARSGNLDVRADQNVLATRKDLLKASLILDETGNPVTQIQFSEVAMERIRASVNADPDGQTLLQLDQEAPVTRPNSIPVDGNILRMTTGRGAPTKRMRIATDRAIILQYGPLPCPTTITAVDPVPRNG